ncbi:ABC transporter ATP-binding protein [Bacillus luteolus]|uniref:ABC transporter ATP-binding protein n=1 Tax=Litchfieldia luteola TaxID=682179 RepID=A0ABR9QM71_9BACI|nr:ABC transporter ATP-binding protein [Cytobacillus luteolus]MBE4909608.1 ABC transporter ATP-binding protein [Cytobacillus luteolus]MBP1941009.1 ABC-2 type transport system ATP-binding protein [Cytobacillus luteolus]
MLTVRNLSKTIEGKKVLDDITFTIGKGSIVGLVGRNGVGKTTLLRTLVGILDPEQGEVLYEEENIAVKPEVKRSIAYVPDSTATFNGYSVKELVRLYKAIYPEFQEDFFYSHMKEFKLPTNRKVRTFSKGMKALMFIILAISTKAKLIILDEPTNGLDAIIKRQVLQLLIGEVSESELSILISTHHLDELEKIADTIMMMKEGKIESIITMDNAKEHFKKVQVVFKGDYPEELGQLQNIVRINQIGRVHTLLIKGDTENTMNQLNTYQPILFEELPMTLEDMFISALGGDDREGH